jgi:hypothetical protein
MKSQNEDREASNSHPVQPSAESGGGGSSRKVDKGTELRPRQTKLNPQLMTSLAETLVSIAKKRIQPEALAETEGAYRQPHEQFVAQLRRLFGEQENVTIVRHYKAEAGKVRPDGMGVTRNRDEWIRDAHAHSTVPEGRAGAWFVVNPTNKGELGDADVLHYRHLLLENDLLPLPLQLAVLQALPLPIVAITRSGKRSLHALIVLHALTIENYRQIAGEILTPLKELGFDSSCRNPSRLTRLAGATRRADVPAPAIQSLVYLQPANAPHEEIGEAIKALHNLLHNVREVRTTPANGRHSFFYDSSTRLYWRRNSREAFISVDEKSVSRALVVELGLSRHSDGDGGGSEVERALNRIQKQSDVAYAGPLAGYPEGIHQDGQRRLLITSGPTLINPTPGPWPLLEALFQRMYVADGIDQRPFVFGWLKTAVAALREGVRSPGQVLVLAGPVGAGKSLFQNLVTEMLGGRSERAYTYFSSETGFNGELFHSEHLILEDEMSSRDMRSRRRFGQALKAAVANTVQRCRRMRCEGVGLKPFWRITLSLNDSPEDLLVLPPLDDGIRDKMILIVVNPGPPPRPIKCAEDRAALWSELKAELPAFLAYLETWSIPEEIQSERYGVAQFHHPRILVALRELAPEFRFLEIVDAVIFRGLVEDFDPNELEATGEAWQGSAMDLEQKLRASDFEREIDNLLSFANASGTFLRRLAKEFPERIRSVKIRGRTLWRIETPSTSPDETDAAGDQPDPRLPKPPAE